MKKEKIIIWVLAVFLLISLSINLYFLFNLLKTKNKSNPQNFEKTKITRVIDADTIETESQEKLRLYGVNAPEYPEECLSEEAKKRVEELVLNKEILYRKIAKDNFGRIIAQVYTNDDIFINETVVEEGFAYFENDKKNPSKELLLIEKAEKKAKDLKRGVWSSLCQTEKQGCLIKGNYREADNTRIYHTPDCYNYDKITIKRGTSDRWFCTEKEAQQAGFKKSKDCPAN
ncbi:MAG: thermonuclease family protein [Patescibacteria group bacterium]|nr:thermonuclease family protein [Patescibacteria group bacterium]